MKFFLPSCATRVADIAEALCQAVAQSVGSGLMNGMRAILIHRRIARVRGLLLAWEARFLAGDLPAARVRPDAVPAASVVRAAADLPAYLWMPRRFAWLCVLVPGEAACFAGQLRGVLAEPGMVALLAACPQALRAVTPLCWMLGIERADYVPDERLVAEVQTAALDVDLRCERDVAATPRMPSAGEILTGLAWIRFIPG